MIFLENVSGLKQANNLNQILKELSLHGYMNTDVRVIDSQHFTAQRRKRVFITAVLPGVALCKPPALPSGSTALKDFVDHGADKEDKEGQTKNGCRLMKFEL